MPRMPQAGTDSQWQLNTQFLPPYQPDEDMLAIQRKHRKDPPTIGQFEVRENETLTIIDGDQLVEVKLVKARRLDSHPGALCQELK